MISQTVGRRGSFPGRRWSALGIAAVALLATACGDDPTGAGRPVAIDVVPRFAQVSGPDPNPALLVDAIRILLGRADETLVVDTAIAWPVGQDTLRARITLESVEDGEVLLYLVEARIGAETAFIGEGTLEVGSGGTPTIAPRLEYIGPGSNAAFLFIGEAPPSLPAGDTLRLTPLIFDSFENRIEGAPVVWSSSDSLAARVDATGLVTAGHALDRTATIVARVAFTEVADSFLVTLHADTIRVTPERHTLEAPGDTIRLTAAALGVDGVEATGATFEWRSTNVAVAAVDSAGLVTALAPGTATIAATLGFLTASATITVGGVPPAAVPATEVAAGESHSCALDTDGTAYCWGANGYHQLGDGTDVAERRLPVAVAGGLTFRTLSNAGSYHTCGITTAGDAYCWGANYSGQLGDGSFRDAATPVPVAEDLTFHSVTAGLDHSCGLTAGGRAYCWGYHEFLGAGATGEEPPLPLPVAGAYSWQALSAGATHTCGVTSDGAVYCWGNGALGQLGNGADTLNIVPGPIAAAGLTFVSITAGYGHTCALTSSGTAYCWGYNSSGQIGDGQGVEGPNALTPVPVLGGHTFDRLAAGGFHTCGITTAGTAYCWGANYSGQLGSGSADVGSDEPVLVGGGYTFRDIAVGYEHTCGVTTINYYCWGDGYNGERGDGEAARSAVPVEIVSGRASYTALAGSAFHTCAIASDGDTYCWGDNLDGQLGDGSTAGRIVPTAVDVAASYERVTVGGQHTCAITVDNLGFCWGRNAEGQVGDSTGVGPRLTPAPIFGGLSWQSISAGILHTCGVASTGVAYCWGANGSGQLGDGSVSARLAPTHVVAETPFEDISAGDTHSCAIDDIGSAYCWGLGYLGDGVARSAPQPTPVLVASTTAFVQISAGSDHTCSIDSSNAAYCWGVGADGQLGTGGTGEALLPVPVAGGHLFTTVRAASRHTCALTPDGAAYCWGANADGQLGDGTYTDSLVPVPVSGGLGFSDIWPGDTHTCGLTTGGRVYCWGSNGEDGTLGTGWANYRALPALVGGALLTTN